MVIAYRPGESGELSVAHVHYNDTSQDLVTAHSCKGTWSGTAVLWKKLYRQHDEEGSSEILETTEDPVMAMIPYRAIVRTVELLVDGRMFAGDASALSKGGWQFKVSHTEGIRAIAEAVVLSDELRSLDYEISVDPTGSSMRNRAAGIARPYSLDVQARLAADEKVFHILDPSVLMDKPLKRGCPWKGVTPSGVSDRIHVVDEGVKSANTLTYQQKKKLQNRESAEEHHYTPQVLDPQFADDARGDSERRVTPETVAAAREHWLTKLESGDYSGPELDRSRYLTLRNTEVEGNPRQTEDYRRMCCEAVGVGDTPDMERYAHLGASDFDVVR